ncbi:START domain-containing protein [Psychrosphaera aquimarina]|uniref:START domain-containing protein n=1 Tax=Psychrosphaera aquimarina TaxID=2044854 RepID=A0ABU3R2B0_9GAMM|nr:START domain-containing protein [Psychrosphaera aquimarina]MDU0113805.1 START domain-containing protein [Psychrosphaera aquimarina]
MIKNVFTIAAVITVQLAVIKSAIAEPSQWQVKVEEPDLVISTRTVPHSQHLEVQATVNFQAPLNTIKAFFTADGECWKWQLRCSRTNIIDSTSESEKTIYVVVDMPWPIDDRDFVLNSTYSEDQTNNRLTLTLVPSEIQAPSETQVPSDLVRAYSTITYELTRQTEDNHTTLNVTMHTEFGGSTPSSLTNSLLHKELKKDLTKLMQLVRSAKANQ